MVAGEQQAVGAVTEHHMAAGVPRGGEDVELALRQADDIAVVEPAVGGTPRRVLRVVRLVHQVSGVAFGQLGGTAAQQHRDLRAGEDLGFLTGEYRVVLPPADADLRPEPRAQGEGLGVVVVVRVGHHHAGDVVELVAERAQSGGQRGFGGRHGPPGVHHDQAVDVRHDVDVHRAQTAVRQRERDAVDPGRHRVCAGLRPVVGLFVRRRWHARLLDWFFGWWSRRFRSV